MNPKVSIVTVCKDAREALLRTQASIFAQTCRDIEWIIVDGASGDGTDAVLRGLTESWIRIVSEPDHGIYDAMNKGLRLARGERVWFLNAGDRLHDEDSAERIASVPPAIEICFGETLVEDASGRVHGLRSEVTPHKIPEELSMDLFRHGMVVSHQAFIPLRAIAPEYNSTRYVLSADLDWMLRILERPRQSVNLGMLARIVREGATMDRWYRSQYERFLILSRHFGIGPTIRAHLAICFRRIGHGRRTRYWR